MQQVAAKREPFMIRLDKVSAFPNERRPRVVWVGVYKAPKTFSALAATVREKFSTLGFELATAAVAHVTLCRLKNFNHPLPLISGFAPIDVSVRNIVLFESLRAGQTTRYEVLERAALGEPGNA